MPKQPNPLTALSEHRDWQARQRAADGADNATTQPIPTVPAGTAALQQRWPRATATRYRHGARTAAALLTAAAAGLLVGSPLLHAAGQQLQTPTRSSHPTRSASTVEQNLLTGRGQNAAPDTTASQPHPPAAPGTPTGPAADPAHPVHPEPPDPGGRRHQHPRPGPAGAAAAPGPAAHSRTGK